MLFGKSMATPNPSPWPEITKLTQVNVPSIKNTPLPILQGGASQKLSLDVTTPVGNSCGGSIAFVLGSLAVKPKGLFSARLPPI